METKTEEPTVADEDRTGADYESLGLTAEQVRDRVARGEINAVRVKTSRPLLHIIRANVFNRFNALLGTLAVVILILDSPRDALFGVVLVLNTLIGIVQELRAKRALDRLSLISAPRARVVRDGEVVEVAREDIVLDDLVVLGPGDQILVDGVVLSSEGLEVDESLLTGESVPVPKQRGDTVLSGSFVSSGTGRFRTRAVGEEAYAQKIAAEARRFSMVGSELRQAANTILRWITWLIFPIAAIFVTSQLIAHANLREAIISAVAGLVGMVPEGLVLLTSMVFALSAVTLARRNVLVQELPAVEGLARVDVICLDKTGTLTEGVLALHRVEVLEEDHRDPGEVLGAYASVFPDGNATMAALAEAYPAPEGWEVVEISPFSSARKWSAASFRDRGTWVLGAPEVLLAEMGEDEDPGGRILASLDRMAERGLRVLLLCRSDRLLERPGELPAGLRPFALVSFMEKIRPDASDTLAYFREQGVAIRVISGDNPRTVAAVSGQVGVPGAEDPVDARQLPDDMDELSRVLETRTVYGRVLPDQKRKMVRALQSRGHVVAMTGDGVNDTLALKDADMGIAMGSGAPSTKSVAQLILLDGRFSTLPGVVAEGRRVMANMERVANLFITKTVYVVLLALGIGLIRWPFPLLPRHITLVGSLTIGIPAFLLSFVSTKRRYRPGILRRVLWFAVPAGSIAAAATFMAHAMARSSGARPKEASTVAVIVLTCVGLAVLGRLTRPIFTWKGGLTGVMGGAFAGVLIIPWFRDFFQLDIPGPVVFFQALGIAAVFVLLLELVAKYLERRKIGRPLALE